MVGDSDGGERMSGVTLAQEMMPARATLGIRDKGVGITESKSMGKGESGLRDRSDTRTIIRIQRLRVASNQLTITPPADRLCRTAMLKHCTNRRSRRRNCRDGKGSAGEGRKGAWWNMRTICRDPGR